MKRLIALLMTSVMMFSIVACGSNNKDVSTDDKSNNFTSIGETQRTETDDNEALDNNYNYEDEDIDNTVGDDNVNEIIEPQPLSYYKLAVLAKEIDNRYDEYTNIWYALELPQEWELVSNRNLSIVYTPTGENINDMDSPYYGGMELKECWGGKICLDECYLNEDYRWDLSYEHNRQLVTFCIQSAYDINPEDFEIKIIVFNYNTWTDSEETLIEVNSTPEEVVPKLSEMTVVHKGTIFRFGEDSYAIQKSNINGGGISGNINYESDEFCIINGTTEKLYNWFKGHITFIDADTLEEIELSIEADLYMDYNEKDGTVKYGYDPHDNEFSFDETVIMGEAEIKYTSDEGHITYFWYGTER